MNQKSTASFWKWLASDEKRVRLIAGAGILGMLLILAGNLLGEKKESSLNTAESENADSFVAKAEDRLSSLLSEVDGVGKVRVMITLESGSESVYAVNENQTQQAVTTYAGGSPSREEENGKTEQSYLLVDTGSGKAPIRIKSTQPVIRGAVIVCEGASDPVTRAAVSEAVTTALGIGANRVCILRAA